MRHAAVIAAFAFIFGCSSEDGGGTTPSNDTCKQTSDCPLGQVCRMPAGKCDAEPTDGVVGRFSCVLGSQSEAGSTDVTGSLGDVKLNVNGVSRCLKDASKGNVSVDMLSSTVLGQKQYMVRVYLAPEQAATKEVTLGPGAATPSPNAGVVAQYDDAGNFQRTIGFTSAGRVSLDAPPVEGQELSGYVEATFVPSRQGTVVGEPCPRGAADCTDSLYVLDPVICFPDGLGPNGPICTTTCKVGNECDKYAGICVGGVCAKACSTPGDCIAPLECGDPGAGATICN